VIVEQVDLIHVQQAAVGGGENPWLESLLAGFQRALDVQRADDAVFCRADGQFHHAREAAAHGQGIAIGDPLAAGVAHTAAIVGVAVVQAIGDDVNLRQQRSQSAGRGGLGRAALAPNQHAANERVHRVEDQRPLHRLLVDDGREWEDRSHGRIICRFGEREKSR